VRAGVIGPVCGDGANILIGRDLVDKVRQDGRIADVAPGDLDGPNFQRLFVDPDVDLAPDPPFGTAMLAGVPLAFILDLDAPRWFARIGGSLRLDVDQQMLRPLGVAVAVWAFLRNGADYDASRAA
jgi:hypothetical protein